MGMRHTHLLIPLALVSAMAVVQQHTQQMSFLHEIYTN